MDINNYISSGIIESYVMGLCTPEEEAEIELNRRTYPQVNDAILQYEKELEDNMLNNATDPGDELDEKIIQSMNFLQAPVVDIRATPGKKSTAWFKFAAAAAILLLI